MRDFKSNQDVVLQTEEYLKNLQDTNHASIKNIKRYNGETLEGLRCTENN